MSSVAWSPVHPAVFAAIDVTGRLDLWNLNNNTESPTASTVLDNSPLLKSLMWSQNGTHLSVGDEYGKISVFQVGEVKLILFYYFNLIENILVILTNSIIYIFLNLVIELHLIYYNLFKKKKCKLN